MSAGWGNEIDCAAGVAAPAVIWKDCVTSFAAACDESPACDATTVHVPGLSSATLDPDTVQVPGVALAYVTARPLEAVAPSEIGP